VPEEAWNDWGNLYPGDAYVDWMGVDGYNWGTSQVGSKWRAFTKETDWRVDSSAAARSGFVPMANDLYFNP
jgi:hypothetical protein